MTDDFTLPNELEMVAFFGSDPVERSVDEGYWCFEAIDDRGVALRFSFNIFERSVQTVIRVDGIPLATISHEGASCMVIAEDALTCQFAYLGAEARLVMTTAGAINVEWSSLRTQ